MVTLTGFADEISSDLKVQLDVLEAEGLHYLEFRGVWEKNVLELNEHELNRVKTEIGKRSISVSSIGSPIGKVSITDDFEFHLVDFEQAIQAAKFFDTRYIRIFSFFIPKGDDPSIYREEVLRRMNVLVKRAEAADIVLLHENEKDIYGDTAERCLDILESCHSTHLRAVFDPANFVQCGVQPFSHAYPLLKDYVEYIHIKDALFEGGKVVPAGQGDGEVGAVLTVLKNRGYNGFMSLEPHLAAAGTFSGFSGPDLFKVATRALKSLLDGLGESYN